MVDSGLGTDCQQSTGRVCRRRMLVKGECKDDSQHGVVLDLGLSEGRTVSGDQDEFG